MRNFFKLLNKRTKVRKKRVKESKIGKREINFFFIKSEKFSIWKRMREIANLKVVQ